MNLLRFLKIITSKLLYVILVPLVVGVIVFLLTRNLPPRYTAFSTIFSGVTSNVGLTVDVVRVDNVATQNEYNNLMTMLKSTSLYEDVSLHLLTQHLLLTKPEKEIISEENFQEFQKNVPEKVKKLVVKGDFDATYANLKKFIVQDEKNYIYRLMHYGSKYYSVQAIENIKSERLANSDLIKISYESDDPGICYNTVKFATRVFVKNYSAFKLSQSNSAVAYFEQKLEEIRKKLNEAEQRLLDFNVDNDIINYYEQTEQVTTQQEKIEIRLQEVKMEFEASSAVLSKLETEVEKRYNINLRHSELLQIREQLFNYNKAITAIELNAGSPDKGKLNELKTQRSKLEVSLSKKVDSLNVFENKSQGIEAQRLLSEWLDAVKNHENSIAMYKSMKERLSDFMKQFKRYAPLGATIKRMEREIDVYEREYLTVLHDLGVARQNEKNIDMRSNMKMYDEAKFPINAIPSKKKLYVLIASLFSLVFYLLTIFLIELLDARIKTPSKLHALTGLKVIAGYSTPSKKNLAFETVENRAMANIIELIRKVPLQNEVQVIQLLTLWDGIDLPDFAEKIRVKLEERRKSARLFVFEKNGVIADEQLNQTDGVDIQSYKELIHILNIHEDYLMAIMPALSDGIEHPKLITGAHITFCFFDANALWTNADDFILSKIKAADIQNIYGVILNAEPDNLEEIYGELPKKRSFVRKFLKNILRKIV